MSDKKKIFPKLKKKLKGFLTDESGKITKKDALGLAAGAVLFSGVEFAAINIVEAGEGGMDDPIEILEIAALLAREKVPTCSSPIVNHGSGIVNGHYSGTPTSGTSTPDCGDNNDNSNLKCTVAVNHGSGIVNGHYSGTPGASVTAGGHCNHGSHGSHSSCGRGCW